MAEIIAFQPRSIPLSKRYASAKVIGVRSGLTIRILYKISGPHDLLVVMDGTADGSTTVAALPAGEMDVAEAIAYSVLASLEAAEVTWRSQEVAWSR